VFKRLKTLDRLQPAFKMRIERFDEIGGCGHSGEVGVTQKPRQAPLHLHHNRGTGLVVAVSDIYLSGQPGKFVKRSLSFKQLFDFFHKRPVR